MGLHFCCLELVYNLHFMHDILIKNDCDSSFQGMHYISVNRNNMSLFAVVLCTSILTDLCMLCFCTTFLMLALQLG